MISDQKLESAVKLDLLLRVMGGTFVAVGSSVGGDLRAANQSFTFVAVESSALILVQP